MSLRAWRLKCKTGYATFVQRITKDVRDTYVRGNALNQVEPVVAGGDLCDFPVCPFCVLCQLEVRGAA